MTVPSYATLAVAGLIGAAVVIGLTTTPPALHGDRDSVSLVDHSLLYQDSKGVEHVLFFGRFGNFDWYYPCEFESGTFTLDADRTLNLAYDNPQFAPRAFRMASVGDTLTLVSSDGSGPTDAELIKGNRLPFG